MTLSEVSYTAISVLVSRVVESEKKNPVFNDPMAVLCFEKLMALSTEEEKNRILKWKKMYAGINGGDARKRVLMARNFDNIAGRFITNNPGCTVINLGCGLDTRFWRIENEKCNYFDNVTLKNDKMSHSSNNNRIFDSSQEINSDTE